MQQQGQNKNSLNMIVPLTVCKQKAENQSSLMMNKNSAHKCEFCIFMRNNKKRNKNKTRKQLKRSQRLHVDKMLYPFFYLVTCPRLPGDYKVFIIIYRQDRIFMVQFQWLLYVFLASSLSSTIKWLQLAIQLVKIFLYQLQMLVVEKLHGQF